MNENNTPISPPNKTELWVIRILIAIGVWSVLNFLIWFFSPEYRGHPLIFILLATTVCYGALRKFYIWYHYFSISILPTPKQTKHFTVDIFTTYFPGEPYEMVVETLEAIQKIRYPHTTYLCDEANDPFLKKKCAELKIVHVTRNNRIDAKAGNINNALKKSDGEICVVLDPDHIPNPNFLDPIVPHFENESVGFVQIVQSYYNVRDTLVARGAAEQTFQFYGPMMMSMNSYGTVNAIGANCTFRRKALESIGGHAAGLSEDMHTAMQLHAKGWKSIYVPQVLAKGLAPSSLISFFKQQLKWARGTFDLLFYVYPKLFRKFTMRQRLHYGILPLHYLVGLITLINFLIPILSLTLSKTPWRGDIIFFATIALPVFASTILVRAYIQKWVIEKRERGFHIVGGLLQITTWWIYFLGLLYTISKKKIPYLPTPKEGEEHTNLVIVIPNIVIGAMSIFAIIFGLQRDFTPFSVIMAFFALMNAFFMLFSIYLASRTTNKNHILRSNLRSETIVKLSNLKKAVQRFSNLLFSYVRPAALSLLIFAVSLSIFAIFKAEKEKWGTVNPQNIEIKKKYFLGIFNPTENKGLSDMTSIFAIEEKQDVSFDIVSMYLAWGDQPKNILPVELIEQILSKQKVPMITWEPWASDFSFNQNLPKEEVEQLIFKNITSGKYDSYLVDMAQKIKQIKKPIFLRFAHEFDNPSYPWSSFGKNTPSDFIEGWRYVFDFFKALEVNNVQWVWNPWKPEAVTQYFPGDDYVDWIGVTILNYGRFNPDGKWYDFNDLYSPFHQEFLKLPSKPVMLAEFGSLKSGGAQNEWVIKAARNIDERYDEIRSVVFFNSAVDENVPSNSRVKANSLNWKTSSLSYFMDQFEHGIPDYWLNYKISKSDEVVRKNETKPLIIPKIIGVRYKKGENWRNNRYVLDRDELIGDFKLMSRSGINTIRYEGQGIYDKNILTYANQESINVLFGFWIPNGVDFVKDSTQLQKLSDDILKTVRLREKNKAIIAWCLSNTIWDELHTIYPPPLLSIQKEAYLNWLAMVCQKIKQLDPERSIIIDVKTSDKFGELAMNAEARSIPIDFYGLWVSSIKQLKTISSSHPGLAKKIMIADIGSEDFVKLGDKKFHDRVVLRNWQDEWQSFRLTFDGLLDRRRNPKQVLKNIVLEIKNPDSLKNKSEVRIMTPAELLFEERNYVFGAVIFENDKWNPIEEKIDPANVSWHLVKNDRFGNPIAIKEMGKGTHKVMEIPKNYDRYTLKISVKIDDYVISDISRLNTSSLQVNQ